MTVATADFDALRAERCPHLLYRQLLAEGGIHRDPSTGNFVVSRYDLVRKVASDTATFSSNTGLTTERDTPIKEQVREMYATHAWPVKHVLLTNDPPEHRAYRALVDRVWSAARVASIQPYIEDLIARAIDRFIDAGEVELIADFAASFPVIIAIDFLGLPRTDAAQVLAWTEAATSIIDTRYDEAHELAMHEQIIDMLRYIRNAAAGKAAAPDDSFLSALQNVEVNGHRLTEQELVWLVMLLLVGGHDSITRAIGSAMIRLIEQPELAIALAANPARIDDFVEEVLRTASPVKALFRRATRDTELEGVAIPAGSIVQIQWGAANRDPARFADPDRFDMDRENVRRHMAFGSGVHLCIGNQLARAEIKAALHALLSRARNFRYAGSGDDLAQSREYVQQGPTRLHIAFDPIR